MASQELQVQQARALAPIMTAEQYESAVALWRDLSEFEETIRASFDQGIKDADKLHKDLIKKRNVHLAPVLEAKAHIKYQQDAFNARERARQAEEARIAREAQQAAIEAARQAAVAQDPFEAVEAVQAAAEAVYVPPERPAPIAGSFGRRVADMDKITAWYNAKARNVIAFEGDMIPGTVAIYRREITVTDLKSVPDEFTSVSTVNKRR